MATKKWVVGDVVRLAHTRGFIGKVTAVEQPGGPKTLWYARVNWTKFPKGSSARTAVVIYSHNGSGLFRFSDLCPPGRTQWEKDFDAKRYPPPKKTKSEHGWTEIDEDGNVVTYPAGTPYPKTTGKDPFIKS